MGTVTATEVTDTTTWDIDPVHSNVQFKVRHMMISNVKGEFTAVTGKLELNGADITQSRLEATIDAASINTGDVQRDAHLKSSDLFDVENFRNLTFKSIRVSTRGVDELTVEGDLSIHGIIRTVVFEVQGPSAPIKDPWGNIRIGLSARTRINRKDFGLTWNAPLEMGGSVVGDEVTITLDVEFVKAGSLRVLFPATQYLRYRVKL
jgi:polyisoprenoid-binding protein YceI